MRQRQRGISTAGVIVIIVVLAAIAGAAAYFLSDPVKTKTDAAYQQFSEWTPENIAKDPVNYLNFAEAQTKEALEKLKASEIAVAQKQAQLEGMREDAQSKISAGSKALDELKALYKTAAADGTWPVTWRGEARSEDWTKRQIMAFHADVEGKQKVLGTVQKGLTTLEAQGAKIAEQRTTCQQQLAQIATNREMLKVQEITDDLKEQLVNMKGMLQATVAAVGTGDADAILTTDSLVATQPATVDEAAFETILAE